MDIIGIKTANPILRKWVKFRLSAIPSEPDPRVRFYQCTKFLLSTVSMDFCLEFNLIKIKKVFLYDEDVIFKKGICITSKITNML